jgi:hypothetical protein
MGNPNRHNTAVNQCREKCVAWNRKKFAVLLAPTGTVDPLPAQARLPVLPRPELLASVCRVVPDRTTAITPTCGPEPPTAMSTRRSLDEGRLTRKDV